MKTRIRQLTEQEKRSLGEQQMIADWLKIFPKGILSIVSDTFDLWKLITEYLPANKEAIMARGKVNFQHSLTTDLEEDEIFKECCKLCKHGQIIRVINKRHNTTKYYEMFYGPEHDSWIEHFESPSKLVIRPDSGDPVDIICGDNYWKDSVQTLGKEVLNKPEAKGVIELLWDIFGGSVNEQGYKVLDPHIGAIYGDSITPERQFEIYKRLAAKGFAATNVVLGVGLT